MFLAPAGYRHFLTVHTQARPSDSGQRLLRRPRLPAAVKDRSLSHLTSPKGVGPNRMLANRCHGDPLTTAQNMSLLGAARRLGPRTTVPDIFPNFQGVIRLTRVYQLPPPTRVPPQAKPVATNSVKVHV